VLGLPLPKAPVILCLGAHADDIEIGCGATLLTWLAERPGTHVHWVVLSGGGTPREAEAQAGATRFLATAAGRHVSIERFRDGHFPTALSELKDRVARLRDEVKPDLVFTHYRDDRHQDHRTVSDVTWQTFRDDLVLEYEVPKYDGDLGRPNVFVPLSTDRLKAKTEHLMAAFPSQRSKRWFTAETFAALPRLRGIECGAPDGYAEAFYARKVVLRGEGT
jgi:LmbE family N-acetylglucosaminyl deacetylase